MTAITNPLDNTQVDGQLKMLMSQALQISAARKKKKKRKLIWSNPQSTSIPRNSSLVWTQRSMCSSKSSMPGRKKPLKTESTTNSSKPWKRKLSASASFCLRTSKSIASMETTWTSRSSMRSSRMRSARAQWATFSKKSKRSLKNSIKALPLPPLLTLRIAAPHRQSTETVLLASNRLIYRCATSPVKLNVYINIDKLSRALWSP